MVLLVEFYGSLDCTEGEHTSRSSLDLLEGPKSATKQGSNGDDAAQKDAANNESDD